VHSLLPMADLIPAMESALAKFSAGEVLQPVRTVLTVGPTKAYYGLMPAYVPEPGSMGAKLVTVFGDNHQRGLPSHLATILLLDPETGSLIALMDGRYITEARTAAVSAVSARFLARAEASTLALIGSGVQARSHLEALQHVRQLKEIRVWSPRPHSREQFIAEMSPRLGIPIHDAPSAEAAVNGADLIVLATASKTPVVESEWVAAGAHVMCVGACRPDQREMAPQLVKRGRLYVDSRAAALVESGDIVMNINDGLFDHTQLRGEIGELVLGRVPGRDADADVTIFKSLGMAVEDVVAADLVFRRATETGAGTELTL
jgi:alanine dehydrogenase